jgi:hypothetical protein
MYIGGTYTVSNTLSRQRGSSMINTPTEVCLLKAANADAIAEKMSGFLRQSWLDIAEGYRELARSKQTSNPQSSDRPHKQQSNQK